MTTAREGQQIFTDMCYPKVGDIAISDFSTETLCKRIMSDLGEITGFRKLTVTVLESFPRDKKEDIARDFVEHFCTEDCDQTLISTIQQYLINVINSALLGILSIENIPLSPKSYSQMVDEVYQDQGLEEKIISLQTNKNRCGLLGNVESIADHTMQILKFQECPKCALNTVPKDEFQRVVKDATLALMRTL